MNLYNELVKIFALSMVNISERSRVLESSFSCDGGAIPGYSDVCKLLSLFPSRDNVVLKYQSIVDESFSISTNNLDEGKYCEFIRDIESEDKITVSLTINKNIESNFLSVYNFVEFSKWILNKSMLDIMSIFSDLLSRLDYVCFDLFDESLYFSTKTIIFKSSEIQITESGVSRQERLKLCREIANFHEFSQYQLIPEDFHFVSGNKNNVFMNMFSNIETIFSAIFISNMSNISDGAVQLKIIGQRTVSFSISLDKSYIYNEEFYKIYSWIYTDGNPVDKAIIARNIISLHCKYSDFLKIDGKTYSSIQSNYALYQKDNVNQYIEVKNKLAAFIIELAKQSGDIVTSLLDKFKNNLLAFITLVITVLLTNILSTGQLVNIFTRDVTVLTDAVLLLSIGYMIVCVVEMNYRIKKIIEGYNNIKTNYLNIFDENDMNDIFKNDELLNKSIVDLHKSRRIILSIWVLAILIIFVSIELLSTNPILLSLLKSIFG